MDEREGLGDVILILIALSDIVEQSYEAVGDGEEILVRQLNIYGNVKERLQKCSLTREKQKTILLHMFIKIASNLEGSVVGDFTGLQYIVDVKEG